MRDQAKKELDEWNKQRLAKLEEAKKKNRYVTSSKKLYSKSSSRIKDRKSVV